MIGPFFWVAATSRPPPESQPLISSRCDAYDGSLSRFLTDTYSIVDHAVGMYPLVQNLFEQHGNSVGAIGEGFDAKVSWIGWLGGRAGLWQVRVVNQRRKQMLVGHHDGLRFHMCLNHYWVNG